MRFAARERAVFAQFEAAFGQLAGGGGAEYLSRLIGRGRTLEVMLSADDYDADLAERYGWINRALPSGELDGFVTKLARRIASFPTAGQVAVKDRVNAVRLAPIDDFRHDSDEFANSAKSLQTRELLQAALDHGFQDREAELSLGRLLVEWTGGSVDLSQR